MLFIALQVQERNRKFSIQIREHNLIYPLLLYRTTVNRGYPYRLLPIQELGLLVLPQKQKIYTEEKLSTLERAGENKKEKNHTSNKEK